MNESSRKRGKALRSCLAIPFVITASLSSAAQAQQEAPAQEPVEKASSEPVELLASFSPSEINSHWHGPINPPPRFYPPINPPRPWPINPPPRIYPPINPPRPGPINPPAPSWNRGRS